MQGPVSQTEGTAEAMQDPASPGEGATESETQESASPVEGAVEPSTQDPALPEGTQLK